MPDPVSTPAWLRTFPELARIQDEAWLRAIETAVPHVLRTGTRLFANSELHRRFILIVQGDIRLYKTGDNGREIVLYRLRGGEICLFNAFAHLLGKPIYSTTAIAETPVSLMSVPPERFNHAFVHSEAFRNFVMGMMAGRLSELMELLEEITFKRLDVRLAQRLCDIARAENKRAISRTHSALATELGSTREVISRVLKEFEHRGWVRLARGEISLRAPEEMQQFFDLPLKTAVGETRTAK